MTTQTASQNRTNAHRMIGRRRWWLGLGLLLVAAALIAYYVTPAPAATTPVASTARASAHDPAMQSVLAYLRAHSGAQPAPTPATHFDPAQQSVMQYVRAHDRTDQPTTLRDQITQALLGYLRGHSK